MCYSENELSGTAVQNRSAVLGMSIKKRRCGVENDESAALASHPWRKLLRILAQLASIERQNTIRTLSSTPSSGRTMGGSHD